MPFCRKCGRRLREYSEVCTDCGTSTTSPIIKVKTLKAKSPLLAKPVVFKNVAKASIPFVSPISFKVVEPTAPKPVTRYKPVTAPKPSMQAKPLQIKAAVKPIATAKLPAPVKITAVKAASQIKSPPPATKSIPTQPSPTPHKQAQPIPLPAPATPPKQAELPKQVEPPKPVAPVPEIPPHDIIKSNVSLKEDYIAHPEDYENQAFDYNLICPHKHFWEEGVLLPISNGKAFCPKCGERLRKPKQRQRRQRYERTFA